MKGQPVFTSFDPVLRETGLTVAVEHPVYGEIIRAAPPIAFSETPGRVAPPCLRGQHNGPILTELGYSEGDITKFEELNVITPPA
jgi:crotonobetainyl-CoA:carnitine CoA-transferase CaiB-like acyl-CoA transferase